LYRSWSFITHTQTEIFSVIRFIYLQIPFYFVVMEIINGYEIPFLSLYIIQTRSLCWNITGWLFLSFYIALLWLGLHFLKYSINQSRAFNILNLFSQICVWKNLVHFQSKKVFCLISYSNLMPISLLKVCNKSLNWHFAFGKLFIRCWTYLI
jgi:hypothetical protein